MSVWALAAATLASGCCIALIAPASAAEVLLGLAAPLAAAVGTHVLVARSHRRDPSRVSNTLMRLFLAKFVVFGAYILVALNGLTLDPVPFLLSFVAYFAALHVAEAAHLRRLFAS